MTRIAVAEYLEKGSDQNGTELRMDTRKNRKLQQAKAVSKAGGSRVYEKIPRQSTQALSALAMGPLVTGYFHEPSLKSVPFGSDPFSPGNP